MAVSAERDIRVGDTYWSPRWPITIGRAPVDLTDGCRRLDTTEMQ